MEEEANNPIFQNSNSPLSHGFTLIEIMLVVVIILIATTISIPIFRGTFQSTQMTDAMRTTMRMARYARSMAILKQTESTLTFKDQQVVLSTGATNGPDGQITRRLPEDIIIDDFENPAQEGLSSAETGYTVRYYPSGMNDGFTLTLSDGDTRRVEISCHPITGKVKVEE